MIKSDRDIYNITEKLFKINALFQRIFFLLSKNPDKRYHSFHKNTKFSTKWAANQELLKWFLKTGEMAAEIPALLKYIYKKRENRFFYTVIIFQNITILTVYLIT